MPAYYKRAYSDTVAVCIMHVAEAYIKNGRRARASHPVLVPRGGE